MHPSLPFLMRQSLNKIIHNLFLDKAENDITIVFGSGRSGTTWLQELINYNNQHRNIFEPFVENDKQLLDSLAYRFITPHESNTVYKKNIDQILDGIHRDDWNDKYNKPFKIYNKRLIKTIRASLFMKWIHQERPNTKIVFIVRNPCAVVYSQLKTQWWDKSCPQLDYFMRQSSLVTEHLEPFLSILQKASNPFERFILKWAIENYVPLTQFNPKNIHLILYENLCTNPNAEIKKLFHFLNLAFDKKILTSIKKPSALSLPHSAIITGQSLVNTWEEKISENQKKKAELLLSYFGLNSIYNQENVTTPLIDFNFSSKWNKI